MAIIGIDLGTTNSLAAVWTDRDAILIPNAFGEFLTPSVVGISDDGEMLIGKVAKERLISHPHLTAAAFKRFMGTQKMITLGDKPYLPEELSAMVLRKIKMDAESYLKESITEAIISVPAYFNDNQRSATKVAAELAGIHAERLINEPSAAALAGHFAHMEQEESCLVIDFGGGTLDVSVVDCFENVIEIVAVAGDNRLGGNDFDEVIADWFCRSNGMDKEALSFEERAILYAQAEYAKFALSDNQETTMYLQIKDNPREALLTRATLTQISESLLRRINKTIDKVLLDSKRSLGAVDTIRLVGGSCKMPVVQSYLSFILEREVGSLDDPDTIVAKGAGIYTGMKQRNPSLRDMMMTDVCPFTLGTGVISGRKLEKKNVLYPMIERNSVLPTSIVRKLYTASHHQTEINVDIYQGEEYFAEDNLLLGNVSIPVPPNMAGKESVTVRFSYDINGILEVEVYHQDTNTHRQRLLIGTNSRLSCEEISEKLRELDKLKIPPAEQEENQFILAKGARLYPQTMGEMRTILEFYLAQFTDALIGQDRREINRLRKWTAKKLQIIEYQLLSQNQVRDYESFKEFLEGEDNDEYLGDTQN